jgi:hypothetical protein
MAPYMQQKERGYTQEQKINIFRNSTDCAGSIEMSGTLLVLDISTSWFFVTVHFIGVYTPNQVWENFIWIVLSKEQWYKVMLFYKRINIENYPIVKTFELFIDNL